MIEKGHFSRFEAIFLVSETAVVLLAAICFLRIVNDDVFITMRYAANLVHGQGLVYSPGERVFGLTTVLLPFLQALFSLPYLGNILLGNYLLQYTLLLGCIALSAVYFRHARFLAALIPLLFFNIQTVGYLGNEMILVLFLSLAALCCLESGKDYLLAICLSLMYLARFDAVLFGAILFVWWFVKRRPRFPRTLAFLLLWASLPVVWHAFSLAYYGEFLSNSVTSKLLGSEGVKSYARILWERHLPDNLIGAYLPVGLIVAAGFAYSWRHIGIYAVWAVAFALLYTLIHAPGITPWYFHTFTFAVITGFAAGAALLTRRFFPRDQQRALVVAVLAGCMLAASHLNYAWEANRYRLYKEVAKQISTLTSENTAIEMNEIGILGYYLRPRPVLDHHFLVTAQGKGKDRFPAVETLRQQTHPAWILLNPYRELTEKEIAAYPGYSLEGIARTPDQAIRLYVFKRQP